MIKAMRSNIALLLAILTVIAYPLLHWAVGHDPAKYTVDALTLGVGIVIAWSWGSAAIIAIRNGVQKSSSKIVLTIWLAWMVLIGQRAYALLYTIYGKPDSWNDGPTAGIITTFLLIAGVYAVVGPAQDEDLPSEKITHLVVAGILGGLVAGAALGIYIAGKLPLALTSLIGN